MLPPPGNTKCLIFINVITGFLCNYIFCNYYMSHIFNLGEVDEFSEKINLDDLYDKKQQQDLNKLEIFNKLLGRVHHKIKMVGRQKADEPYTWFLVPEVMIGVPKYDQGACIAYILDKLRANKFIGKYIHPNMLFISWKHWIPSYVRS